MRMTATVLREAIELGNSGAQLLAMGSTVDALLAIRRAMQLLQQEEDPRCTVSTATQQPSPQPTTTTTDMNPDGVTTLSTTSSDNVPLSFCGPNDNTPFCGLQDITNNDHNSGSTLPLDRRHNVCYRYRRPMIIPCDVVQMLCRPSSHHYADDLLDTVLYIVSSCLVMNMALACHEMGIETGTDTPLGHAHELYENLLRNTITIDCTSTSSTNNNTIVRTTNTLLQCLAVNNLVCLHYERCDYEACQWYLKCLEDVLCYNASSSCYCLSKQLSQYDIEEIQLNLVFVRPPVAAHAA